METTEKLFDHTIPHIREGQRVKDWRVAYSAYGSVLSEKQLIGYIPVVVARSLAEQKWAVIAAKKETLENALDELELRIDGKKPRFVAITDFLDLKPNSSLDEAGISEYFFKTVEAGQVAGVAGDMIASKFLQFAPEGSKIFEKNEDLIKPDMNEDDLITLYDAVKEKMAKKASTKCSPLTHAGDKEDIPEWALDLKGQIEALSVSIEAKASTSCSDARKSDEVFFGRKETDGEENLVCTRCSGIGHDVSVCTSKRLNRSSKPKNGKKER